MTLKELCKRLEGERPYKPIKPDMMRRFCRKGVFIANKTNLGSY